MHQFTPPSEFFRKLYSYYFIFCLLFLTFFFPLLFLSSSLLLCVFFSFCLPLLFYLCFSVLTDFQNFFEIAYFCTTLLCFPFFSQPYTFSGMANCKSFFIIQHHHLEKIHFPASLPLHSIFCLFPHIN